MLQILEVACGLVAVFSAAVAAWFEYRERWQTEEERAKTRASYGKKWEAIRDSGLLQLPETAIESVLAWKTRFSKAAMRSMEGLMDALGPAEWTVAMVPVVGGAAGGWITYGWIGALALASASGVFCSLLVVERYTSVAAAAWLRNPTGVLWAAGCLFTAGIWLNILLGLGIASATGLMLILLPVYMFVLALPLVIVALIGNETTSSGLFDTDSWAVFGMATAVSFFVTLCSLLIGSQVAPDAWIPKTLQMLMCNVVLDGLTMVATFAILARAVGEKRKYPIPVAILIDALVAALFACASLWLGLIGSEHALSIRQVLGVLIARSTEDTAAYALGPYFWAMHTTFLPTLGYLGLILMFWIAKLIVFLAAKVLKKGHEIEKPHSMTAGLFGLVGAAALLAAAVLHVANNDVPNPSSAPPAQVVEDGA